MITQAVLAEKFKIVTFRFKHSLWNEFPKKDDNKSRQKNFSSKTYGYDPLGIDMKAVEQRHPKCTDQQDKKDEKNVKTNEYRPQESGRIVEEGRKENTTTEALLFFQFNAQPVGRTEATSIRIKSNEKKGDNYSDENSSSISTEGIKYERGLKYNPGTRG